MAGRLDARDVPEGVRPEGDVVRAHEPAALVDPHRGGDVDHVVEISHHVTRVDRAPDASGAPPRSTGGRRRRSRRGRSSGSRNRARGVPRRAPATPAGRADTLTTRHRRRGRPSSAMLGQSVGPPIEIGQREVGRLQRQQSLARARAETPRKAARSSDRRRAGGRGEPRPRRGPLRLSAGRASAFQAAAGSRTTRSPPTRAGPSHGAAVEEDRERRHRPPAGRPNSRATARSGATSRRGRTDHHLLDDGARGQGHGEQHGAGDVLRLHHRGARPGLGGKGTAVEDGLSTSAGMISVARMPWSR